jgi:putative NADPH-quinone reductase
MPRNILIVDGHPDPDRGRFLHALAAAYKEGAVAAGHSVREIRLARLEFPLLGTNADFQKGIVPPVIANCQESMQWADHWVILYPLWLGSMPALLKGFFEQSLRPGFAFAAGARGGFPKKLLAGRSARIVVTMGMPAFFYRWYFRAHSLKSLERNILAFVGIKPVNASIIGSVDGMTQKEREGWLETMQKLGRQAR